MKIDLDQPTPTEVKVQITLDQKDLAGFVERTLIICGAKSKPLVLERGKAPNYIIERELSVNAIQNRVLEMAVESKL